MSFLQQPPDPPNEPDQGHEQLEPAKIGAEPDTSGLKYPDLPADHPANVDATTNVQEGSFGDGSGQGTAAPAPPPVPAGATHESVQEMLREFMDEQRRWRSQVVQEVRRGNVPPPSPAAGETSEDRARARKAAIEQAPFYCHVCGRLHEFLRECVGPYGANHPPVVVQPTDELKNEPDPRDKDAHLEWQAGHTAAPTLSEQLAEQARIG